jgi:hypothetical protein
VEKPVFDLAEKLRILLDWREKRRVCPVPGAGEGEVRLGSNTALVKADCRVERILMSVLL